MVVRFEDSAAMPSNYGLAMSPQYGLAMLSEDSQCDAL